MGTSPQGLGTAAGQVSLEITSGGAGFAAWGADRIVNLGGSGATVTWGSGSFVNSGAPLIFGSSTSNATLDFQNGIDLAGSIRTILLSRGVGSGPEAKISGVISGSGGGLTIDANGATGGRLLLTNGNNSYNNTTSILGGELWLGANATSGSGNTVLGSATSAVLVGNSAGSSAASLLTAAPITVGRDIRIVWGNSGTMSLGGVRADASTFSGTIILGSDNAPVGKDVSLTAASGGTVTFSGLVRDATGITGAKSVVTKSGAGTVALTNANTYAGGTVVECWLSFCQ